ncbi:Na+/H+ antiporter subunit E [Brevibacterium luteolum]|uniref:Na+/H+ antiporter subunit E n=1 Tax=Brevibacterium luteolum TaxID=199591 RepID=UPI0021AFE873|nr:Na+/H+ antiporter subunit E [Brevibacterium luteolum]MCT1920564.1 Na+/H+ antiporter subunit E [Brevibacterium luteolum]
MSPQRILPAERKPTLGQRLRWFFRLPSREHWLLLAGLIALWVMLWDDVSVLTVGTGLIIAWTVSRIFYLPPVEFSGRMNVWYVIVFIAWFTWSMVKASIDVAWLSVRPAKVRAGSLVAIDLHTRSDLLITLVALVAGLIPGSFATEINRARSTIYLHVLNCASDEDVEEARALAYRIEYHLVRAIGSAHDIAILNDWRQENGQRPVLEHLSITQRRRKRP